ncbi:MAG: hypothetical protein H7329_19125 [Opitutaceae bacterium]|nr:hypothetical protein [Cytophagales bacterium]
MNKKVLLLLFLLPVILYAQETKHSKGMKEIQFGGGKTDLGYYGEAGFHNVLSTRFKLGGVILYEAAKYKTIIFKSVYFLPELRYKPIDLGNYLFINLGIGGVLNYSIIDLSATVENGKSVTGMNYGAELFIEPEFYVSDNIMLYGVIKRMWVTDRFLGTTILLGGVGVKYSF